MPNRWIGVVVASAQVVVVDAVVPDSGPIEIQADHSWPLQSGDRPAAYPVMHQQVVDYVREHGIQQVVILPGEKSSARITADPAIFDDHFESHQLLLPDGPLFRRVAAAADGVEANEVVSIQSLAELVY